ncbi:hypothetical protein RJ639_006455 [Escallonia herrerae]|uniref:Fe2OG dioxygenase domain-containing protein n=1 Tax=Escallonia herrerae TaxID=1293975 RepID=A0AA88VWZ2_9ASTE|nr:hypothetical protein RJ639_006455 [Escallonia herrerae]
MAGVAHRLTQAPSAPSVSANADSNKPFCFVADDEIPIIDYSMLISADHNERSKAILDLGKACTDYGFFTVVNHGMPESFIKEVLERCSEFFDLTEREKIECEPKCMTDKIRWSKGSKPGDQREFLKLISHPEFHCPAKPAAFSDILQEYCNRSRDVALEILRGISKSLGLEDCYVENAMRLKSGFDVSAVNSYPPCSLSDNPIGLPSHSDPSLLILLIQSVDGGLQLQRDGKWVRANIAPNSIVAHIGDHLEILTNGKYKSAVHRVIGNNSVRRIGLPIAFGPSLDALVSSAPELVDQSHPSTYPQQTYAEYWEATQCNMTEGRAKLNTGSALNTEGLFGWGKARFSTGSSLNMKGIFGWGKAEFNSGSALNMKGIFGWGKAKFNSGSALNMKGIFGWGKAEFNTGSALNMKGIFEWAYHRSKAIQGLGKACGDYGCFTVVNHGLPESFIRGVLEECSGFFDLAETEKTEYEPKGPADKISEILQEYCKRTRAIALEIFRGISKSLGLEECYIENATKLESGFDICGVLTNGKYKSAMHRVIGNNKVKRIGVPIAFGPSLHTFVKPAPEFVDESHPPA